MSKFSKTDLNTIRVFLERGIPVEQMATLLKLTPLQVHGAINGNKKRWAVAPEPTSGERAWASRVLNGTTANTRKRKGNAEPKPTKVKVIQSGRIRFEIHNDMVNRVIIGKEGVVTIF